MRVVYLSWLHSMRPRVRPINSKVRRTIRAKHAVSYPSSHRIECAYAKGVQVPCRRGNESMNARGVWITLLAHCSHRPVGRSFTLSIVASVHLRRAATWLQLWRERGDDLLEARVAAQAVPIRTLS